MKLWKLECLNQDGQNENNGYFLKEINADMCKEDLDGGRENIKYGIIQNKIIIYTMD